MMTPARAARTPVGSQPMQLVLLAYIAVAVWTAWVHRDGPAFVLHAAGAISALCALGLAVGNASLRGELEHQAYGPLPESREEEW